MESLKRQNQFMLAFLGIYFVGIIAIIYRIEPYASYEAGTKVTLMFTAYLVIFAFIEAYSTYMQVMQNEKRNIIDDLRNELEKVYGPLYVILSNKYAKRIAEKSINRGPLEYSLNQKQFSKLNDIFSTFPHMIPLELYTDWRDSIQGLDEGYIPLDFVEQIHIEYERRINEYNKLLDKN